jgi:predicted RNase H-like nuclease (RuvC/YqgF family)
MQDSTQTIAIVSAITAAITAIITSLGAFILKWYTENKKQSRDDNTLRFENLKNERIEMQQAQAALRQDLMQQILNLRTEILALQKDNIRYIKENASLQEAVNRFKEENEEIKKENAQMCARISELENEIHKQRKDDLQS